MNIRIIILIIVSINVVFLIRGGGENVVVVEFRFFNLRVVKIIGSLYVIMDKRLINSLFCFMWVYFWGLCICILLVFVW